MEGLSKQLNAKYGSGFSVPNLRNFRQFYLLFQERVIHYPAGSELRLTSKHYPSGSESEAGAALQKEIADDSSSRKTGFNPDLSWSHYRALMRVSDIAARDFYETEAAECGWSKVQLERQIQTSYYERILANRGKEGLSAPDRERLPGESLETTARCHHHCRAVFRSVKKY